MIKATIVALILLCGIAAAGTPISDTKHFIIAPLIWDESDSLEAGISVTYTFGDQSLEQITADDGSCVFDCANFNGIREGDEVEVSCKYGIKQATIDYNKFGQGVTFNEPSEDAAIAVYATMGFIATAIGGGLYWLRKKIKKIDMEEE